MEHVVSVFDGYIFFICLRLVYEEMVLVVVGDSTMPPDLQRFGIENANDQIAYRLPGAERRIVAGEV